MRSMISSGRVTFCRRLGNASLPLERACRMRRPSVSRMREIRTSGLKGDLRKRSPEHHRA